MSEHDWPWAVHVILGKLIAAVCWEILRTCLSIVPLATHLLHCHFHILLSDASSVCMMQGGAAVVQARAGLEPGASSCQDE